MEETPSEDEKSDSFWKHQLPLERETCIFILLNAMDVFMTYLMLVSGNFRESNLIADYFLAGWGIKGLVYFKFGLVAFVTVVAQLVARKNFSTGRNLLNFGSLIVGGVVIYSFALFLRSSTLFG
ncbi:MAG: DUF5658 family protein [Gimesia sp.]